MVDWRNYLEGDYDGKNTSGKPNQATNDISAREKIEDISTAKKIADEITKRYKEFEVSEKKKEYLIDGAVLVCSKASLDDFKLMDGTEVHLAAADHSTPLNKAGRLETVLHVRRDYSNMSVGISRNATVLDCRKGELAELDAKSGEDREVSFMANIYPFRCNCMEPADRVEEQEMIKANMKECMKNGVCQYLMRLNDEWENWPGETGGFHEKRAVRVLEETEGGEEKAVIKNADCITMKSMIFCRHGGLITPDWSGQTLVTNETEQKILYGGDLDDDARWLVTVMDESTTREGRIAVFYEVLNRCKHYGKTIYEVVSPDKEYNYHLEYYKKKDEDYTEDQKMAKEVADEVLKHSVPNPIGSCRYHFSKKDGYDIWAEGSKCSYVYIIADNPVYKNVFYEEYKTVHNFDSSEPEDKITIYDNETKSWLYEEGKVEW